MYIDLVEQGNVTAILQLSLWIPEHVRACEYPQYRILALRECSE